MQGKNNSNRLYKDTLSKIISTHRKNTKKSMYLISAESSISKSTWRELEKGMRNDINLSTFCKIAEGLDIPPHELLKELTDKLGDDFSFSDLNGN